MHWTSDKADAWVTAAVHETYTMRTKRREGGEAIKTTNKQTKQEERTGRAIASFTTLPYGTP
jgi:hypothetical protein